MPIKKKGLGKGLDSLIPDNKSMKSVTSEKTVESKEDAAAKSGERVNAYEALKAVTINAAHQIFEENRRGSIDVGKLADFVVLDKDPLSEMSYELKDIKVLMTIKKDDVIYRRQS